MIAARRIPGHTEMIATRAYRGMVRMGHLSGLAALRKWCLNAPLVRAPRRQPNHGRMICSATTMTR